MNDDLEQRRERSAVRLHPRGDERLPSVPEYDDITGLDVERQIERGERRLYVVFRAIDRETGTAGKRPKKRRRKTNG